jgi:hypothetical protein
MKTKEEIEKIVKDFMSGHEEGTFVRNKNGVLMYYTEDKQTGLNLEVFFEDLLEYAFEYHASQLQQEWIPVEVRLPEIEEDVMLLDCWKTTDGKEDRVDIRIGHLESFTTIKSSAGLQYSCEWAGTEYAFNITHWRPLPPLPQPYNPKQL